MMPTMHRAFAIVSRCRIAAMIQATPDTIAKRTPMVVTMLKMVAILFIIILLRQ